MAENTSYYIEPDMRKNGITGGHQIFRQTAEPHSVSAKAHIHSCIEFIYVEKGSFTAWLGENEFIMEEGDLLLIRSGEIHRILAGSSDENGYCVIKIDPDMIFMLSDESNAARYILSLKLGKERKSLWKRKEIEENGLTGVLGALAKEKFSPSYGSDIAIKCKCAELLYIILRETVDTSDTESQNAADSTVLLINKAIEYINLKYSDDITAMECSKTVGLSYSYFSRTFKAVTGRSFSEYLGDVRINRSKKLLLTTDKQVSEIAYECGFSDPCYYISSFRRKNGITPKQYRQKTVSHND